MNVECSTCVQLLERRSTCRHWSKRKELDTFRHDPIFCWSNRHHMLHTIKHGQPLHGYYAWSPVTPTSNRLSLLSGPPRGGGVAGASARGPGVLSIVHLIQSWFLTHYRILRVVLYALLRLSPPLPYSELATVLAIMVNLKLYFSVNLRLNG